jgi:accessory gene regulator B
MTILIKNIVTRWTTAGVIDKSDEDIYTYGLDLILFSILNLIVILITAAIFGRLLESVILMIAIIPIQAFGGGYHAATHFRCFLIMYIGWWAVMFILPFVSPSIATVLNCLAVTLVLRIAPVSHVNVPMSDARKLKMRTYVRGMVFAIAIMSSVLIWIPFINDNGIGIVLAVGIGIAAFSMLFAHFINFIKAKKNLKRSKGELG